MRRILLVLSVAMIAVAVMAVPAFAAPCPCTVPANDQAQGNFFTGSVSGIENSNGNAFEGLTNAFMLNFTP